jgi:hypothetical protein
MNKTKNIKVLVSGVDSLFFSFMIEWKNEELFTYFDELKLKAQSVNADFPGSLKPTNEILEWQFQMLPNGSRGYEWLLIGHDFALKIGKWQDMITRPNIMAEIRSETLWCLGLKESISYLIALLEGIGATIIECKLSRLDLCMDILLPEKLWTMNLVDHAVTYADDKDIRISGRTMTGFYIGAGKILARIYDKVLEIKKKSKKDWMFDVWGIKEVPEKMKVIRVEFQMRREFLNDMHMNTIEDLLTKAPGLWSYCSSDWLKFQDCPLNHHTMRKNLPWWDIVQNNYNGCQKATPLVRDKAVSMDIRQRFVQAAGNISSIQAIIMEQKKDDREAVGFDECLKNFISRPEIIEVDDIDLAKKIKKKRAKFHRVKDVDHKQLKYIVLGDETES